MAAERATKKTHFKQRAKRLTRLTGGWREKSPCYCGRGAGVRSNKRECSGARGTRGPGCSLWSGRAWTGRGRSGWGDRLYGGASHRALVGGEKIRTATPRAVSKTVNGTSNQRGARYKRPAAGSQGNCGETRPASGRIGRSPKRTAAGSAAGMKGAKDCGVLSLPDAPLRPAHACPEGSSGILHARKRASLLLPGEAGVARHRPIGRFEARPRPLSKEFPPPQRPVAGSQSDPGCVKTPRGMTAPAILRLVVTFRAKNRKNSSSARH